MRAWTARAWTDAFEEAYEGFCDALERGKDTWLDPYAAEHPSEFFAVISEAFFEDPAETRRRYPDVFDQLRLFYDRIPHDHRAQADRSTCPSRARSSAGASSSASTTRRSTRCRPSWRRSASVAWDGYIKYRKSPRTQAAGAGVFRSRLSSSRWNGCETRSAIRDAEKRQRDPASPSRILIVSGATRSEHTCPGEVSKTRRLADHAAQDHRGAAPASRSTCSSSRTSPTSRGR